LPYLDKVIYRPITDETARLTSLKTGDLDIVDTVPSKDVGDLRNSTDLTYKEIPALAFFGFYVNNTVEPFNNKALRQALAYAIDRDAILKSVFFNIGVVSNGPIPPPSWAYDASYKPYTRDLAKAKAKLTEGGKADGLSFKMQVPAGSPQNLQEAQIIRDQLKEAGITMDIEQLEFSKILDNLDKKQFSTSLVGWSGRIDPDGNMYSHFRSDGTNNNGGYNSPKVDELLASARSGADQATRKVSYQDAQKQLMDDAAYIFINHNVAIQCSTKKLQGFVLLPDSLMRFTGLWLS